jgi:hypothetical protein
MVTLEATRFRAARNEHDIDLRSLHSYRPHNCRFEHLQPYIAQNITPSDTFDE